MIFFQAILGLLVAIFIGWIAPLWLMAMCSVSLLTTFLWARLEDDKTGNESSFISGIIMLYVMMLAALMWLSYWASYLLH